MEDLYTGEMHPKRRGKLLPLPGHIGRKANWAAGRRVGETGNCQRHALLTQHELVQILIASCATPEEMVEKYDEVMVAVEQYTRECDRFCSGDQAEIAFRRIQLFDVFSPFVVGLVRGGH